MEYVTKVTASVADSSELLGQPVVKFGRTTGLTKGIIVDIDADIVVDYTFGSFRFVNQVLIQGKGFANDGDSGAVVITQPADAAKEREAVAMVVAPVGEFTAACPLQVALDILGKELNPPTVLTLAGAPGAAAGG